jgi:hypothetical protein
VGYRGDPRPCAGTHVDRGPRDGAGGGHAAEQRRGDVREALADQLAVGVVTLAVGQPVRDLRREQALQRGERGHSHDSGEKLGQAGDADVREARARQPCGDRPDPGDGQICEPYDERSHRDGDE